jgi:DNA-binding NtrC family response regulator
MPKVRKLRTPLYVSIVAGNPETLDGLQNYLEQAGVSSHSTRAVKDLAMVAPAFATATVIFPDDFPDKDSLALVHHLRNERPQLLALIVTRQPARFRDAAAADGRSLPPIILPRPSFGWDILDVVRAHNANRSAS